MAISTGSNGRGSRRRSTQALSEINVTPFVDVVLVLLIIFMLTAHVMEYGLEVNVPQTKGSKQAVRDLPVSNGVVNMSKNDHLGLDQRARVIVRVVGGKWQLQ